MDNRSNLRELDERQFATTIAGLALIIAASVVAEAGFLVRPFTVLPVLGCLIGSVYLVVATRPVRLFMLGERFGVALIGFMVAVGMAYTIWSM